MDNQFGNCAQQQAPAEPIVLQIPERAQFEQFAKEHEEAQARMEAQPEVQRAQPAQEEKKEGNLFSRLFRTRIKVAKGKTPIVNVSALFSIEGSPMRYSSIFAFGTFTSLAVWISTEMLPLRSISNPAASAEQASISASAASAILIIVLRIQITFSFYILPAGIPAAPAASESRRSA